MARKTYAQELANIGERLATMEQMHRDEGRRVTALEEQVAKMSVALNKQRSFIAGVIFTASAVVSAAWAAFTYLWPHK